MIILHGTWIPEPSDEFIQQGAFYIWAESETKSRRLRKKGHLHPRQLVQGELVELLTQELGIKPLQKPNSKMEDLISPQYFWLPSVDGEPLPSLELSRYLETDLPESFDWDCWEIDCYMPVSFQNYQLVPNVIATLNDLHFIALYNLADVQLGADLLFWYHYTQTFKQVILRDQYIPALKYREILKRGRSSKTSTKSSKTSTKVKTLDFEIYPGWEIVGDRYESNLQSYVEYMPLSCTAGCSDPGKTPEFFNPESLLRHFSEYTVNQLVLQTTPPQSYQKKVEGSIIQDCLNTTGGNKWISANKLEQYQQWQVWRDRISRSQTGTAFYLCFCLEEPANPDDPWQILFQVAPKSEPSLRIYLADFWRATGKKLETLRQQLGDGFEQNLLINLGYAARIYDKIWQGMETDKPTGITVDLNTAFEFLKEAAWILEDAGYKVIIPAWWTPKGRQKAKIKLRAKGKSLSGGEDKAKSYFSFDRLVDYEFSLAVGDQPVTEEEWNQLVNAKAPLVQFRGQWMELDQDKMQEMLEFWKQQKEENPDLSLMDFMKLAAGGDDDEVEVEFDRDDVLSTLMGQLQDKSQLAIAPDPDTLQGTLREYQKRGLSWLSYLEQLGLNGCLADDMGLGKTVQVIARLAQEREIATEEEFKLPPTLLIAPTSVLGNWQREVQKFAPQITTAVHHGGDRAKDSKTFKAICRDHDVMITSFTLARKDAKLFSSVTWHRVVLDEAQNIKNPKAAQTKAILKLNADHRLALTGTPVENRLMDLWSIFNFLNPGYLGTQAQFRKQFELPIQKENQQTRSLTLKRLVEPFILRRVKTDKSIIKDLPDKVEQKLYCNLTKEQASLYEAVLKDVEKQLNEAEGIQRKGLILATLTKLKQICNHPRQFLQDESDFTPERSHKLSRLLEMIDEVVDERESALVFTQFREIGDALEKYLRHTRHVNTYYLHGGTSRTKRESMIEAFQDPDSEPSIFVLSLKAAGVGITLTQANHVFHFDRWWNPAVENQATDRAFRIGQTKNVFVHKFVAMGTLEERIDEMIEDKKKLAGAIVGSDESWLTELDNDAFKELIALNKNAILE
ncbi:MAG: DEAD/DEAH box helicase [Cyanothece sp. SIO2G6]|nr:DEAD/DEAH box helicase [Cyanothece sp. SIO2G6]